MNDTRLVRLGREKAVELIKDEKVVKFQRGIWNEWEERKPEDVIPIILDTRLYGADVWLRDGVYYVSCPVSSDMW